MGGLLASLRALEHCRRSLAPQAPSHGRAGHNRAAIPTKAGHNEGVQTRRAGHADRTEACRAGQDDREETCRAGHHEATDSCRAGHDSEGPVTGIAGCTEAGDRAAEGHGSAAVAGNNPLPDALAPTGCHLSTGGVQGGWSAGAAGVNLAMAKKVDHADMSDGVGIEPGLVVTAASGNSEVAVPSDATREGSAGAILDGGRELYQHMCTLSKKRRLFKRDK